MAAAVLEFNAAIKQLVLALKKAYPRDEQVARTHRRVVLAADQAPTMLIELIGPRLMEYRVQITEGNAEFFMAADYQKELREGAAENADNARIAAAIITLVKKLFRSSDEAQRGKWIELVQDMFYAYCDFVE